MSRRAENKVSLVAYIDKDLKKDFKKYTSDSDMSKVLTDLVEAYVKKAKRQENKKQQ